jgi:cellulose synthase/poly-beta-1,6-N-acetylglucosamine synthase-like glycosyltransferase
VLPGLALTSIGMIGIGATISVVGIGLQIVFIAFFARHLAFAISALHTAPGDLEAQIVDTGFRPAVAVIVACKNEEQVIDKLVASLMALDYPAELMQLIVVNDGSTDRTAEILTSLARDHAHLTAMHRAPEQSIGKSAALNAALAIVRADITIIFDGDHQPRPDVVRRLVRHFEDPTIAAVQGRCQISNPDDSLISRLVAIDYLAGYLVNEYGRQSIYRLPAYGGANCAVRTSSLRELGGWNVGSVTEDTDLTIRLTLTGQRVRYDVTAVDEEEGVITVGRFWRQRYRWARGHQQVWRDYRAAVWRSPIFSRLEKVEMTMFLLVFHVPVLSGLGLFVLLLWGSGVAPVDQSPVNLFLLWTLLLLGPLLELSAGLLLARSDRREAPILLFFLPLFLVSVALCAKAWFDGIVGTRYSWGKTSRAGDLPAEAAPA